MHRYRRFVWLTGTILAAVAGGCQSPGSETSSARGPSPGFGLHAPPQSEPPLDESAPGPKTASRAGASQVVDDGDGETRPSSAGRRAIWRTGGEKDPAQRKPLPVADRTAPADDDDLEL